MPENTTESEPTSDERDRGLHRHGDPDPSKWDEQPAVTGRANDTPLRDVEEHAVPNTTLAERAAARRRPSDEKAVDPATTENKAVRAKDTKKAR